MNMILAAVYSLGGGAATLSTARSHWSGSENRVTLELLVLLYLLIQPNCPECLLV